MHRAALFLAILVASGPLTVAFGAEESATVAAAAVDIPQATGFVAKVVDGRIWVFRSGSPEALAFEKKGETPDKQITRIHGGPDKMTIKAPDADTLDAYLKAIAK